MIPNLDEAPYSEGLRRLLYDAVSRIVDVAPEPRPETGEMALMVRPEAANLAVFYAWGRWFAVWQDLDEDTWALPLSRVWQVVRVSSDPRAPEGIMLHEV